MKQEIEIAYLDVEKTYAKKLSAYVSKQKKIPFKLRTFCDEEYFWEYIASEKIPDYVMIDTSFVNELSSRYAGPMIILDSSEQIDDVKNQKELHIFKYQAGDVIVRALLSIVLENRCSFQADHSLEQIDFIVVYSPVNRCGKTSFGKALAEVCAEKKKTLFLSFDCRMDGMIQPAAKHCLSDVIMYYLEIPNCLSKMIPLAIQRLERADYLVSAKSVEELYQLSWMDWNCLLSFIVKIGGYDALVLDLSQEINEYDYLISNSDVTFVPMLDDELSLCKVKNFETYMEAFFEQDCHKMIKVRLFDKKGDGDVWGSDTSRCIESIAREMVKQYELGKK